MGKRFLISTWYGAKKILFSKGHFYCFYLVAHFFTMGDLISKIEPPGSKTMESSPKTNFRSNQDGMSINS